jgi:hypothetical protein
MTREFDWEADFDSNTLLRRVQEGRPVHIVIDASRLKVPGWAIDTLEMEEGETFHLVVLDGDLLACCPRVEGRFNRARLLADGSVPLPTAVLKAMARRWLVFAELRDGAVRLRPALHSARSAPARSAPAPAAEATAAAAEAAAEAATAGGAKPRRAAGAELPAVVSAAGRLLVPPAVIAGLGVRPGDTLVFGWREGNTFEVLSLAALRRRAAAALEDLAAGADGAEELVEDQLAEQRGSGGDDPLAGTWEGEE